MSTVPPPAMRFTTFQNRAATCARICAVALGISIPISVALDNVLLAIILISWLAAGDYRSQIALVLQNRVAVAAGALFCLLAAGLIHSSAPAGDGLNMLGKYVDLAFVPLFVCLFRDERMRRQAWLALAFALALTLILSYAAWLGVGQNSFLIMGNRGNPVVFKEYLTHSLLMAFGAFLFAHFALHAQSLRGRILWSALALLAAINVLVAMQGRTGQLILAALAACLAYSVWRWRGVLLAATATAVLAVALMLGFAPATRMSHTLDEWRDWQPEQVTKTATGLRLEFYRNSLELVRAHPLIGVGTGGFAKAYASRVAGTDLTPTTNPHSEYLNIAMQLGVVGLVALLYLFYCQWRLAPALPTAFEIHLARGLIVTIALGCLFNSLLMDHVEGLLFAWAGGVLFAGLRSPPVSSGAPKR